MCVCVCAHVTSREQGRVRVRGVRERWGVDDGGRGGDVRGRRRRHQAERSRRHGQNLPFRHAAELHLRSHRHDGEFQRAADWSAVCQLPPLPINKISSFCLCAVQFHLVPLGPTCSLQAWSITYVSWLTFVFLMWSCTLWMVRDRRRYAMLSSPFMVTYGNLLIVLQYIWSFETMQPISGLFVRKNNPFHSLSSKVTLPPPPPRAAVESSWCLVVGFQSQVTTTQWASFCQQI